MSDLRYRILNLARHIDNRRCADCDSALRESSNIFASIAFKVWLCRNCATCHDTIEPPLESRIIVATSDEWTHEMISLMEEAGSNIVMNSFYERFIPFEWEKITWNSTTEDRYAWIQAKYYGRYFMIPQSKRLKISLSPTKNKSLLNIVEVRNNKLQSHCVLPTRIADCFLSIGLGKLKSATSSSLESVHFVPTILNTFPEPQFFADSPPPEFVGSLTFPKGLQLSSVEQSPFAFSFVLTDVNRIKLYGCTLIIYEPIDPKKSIAIKSEVQQLLEKNIPLQTNPAPIQNDIHSHSLLYAPKALTILSHYPFYHLFTLFLEQMYHVSMSAPPIPIERYFNNFFKELPLPPQGRTEVHYSLPKSQLIISRPPKNHLPMVDFSYRPLFTFLSIDNILTIFSCLCAEMTVCVCSSNIALLTPIQESLLSFLFPFVWQGCYIPVLPINMMEVLDAPVPFLVGTHIDYLRNTAEKRRPKSVTFVNVDNDEVIVGQYNDEFLDNSNLLTIPNALPKSRIAKLKKVLHQYGECIYKNKTVMEQMQWAGFPFPKNEHLTPIKHYISQQGVIATHNDKYLPSLEKKSNLQKLGIVKPSNPVHANTPSETNGMALYSGNSFRNLQDIKDMQHGSVGFPYRHPVACTITSGTAMNESSSSQSNELSTASPLDPSLNFDSPDSIPFDANEIREAFLRFFAAIFKDYEDFLINSTVSDTNQHTKKHHKPRKSNTSPINTTTGTSSSRGSERDPFDFEHFLIHVEEDPFIKQMMETQMFSHFISERTTLSDQSEIQFFNEHIIAKRNRSKFAITKSSTPFLSDTTDYIHESYTVPTPSNAGLSEKIHQYTYTQFPNLQLSFAGMVRESISLVKGQEKHRIHSQSFSSDLQDKLLTLSRTLNRSTLSDSQRKSHNSAMDLVDNPDDEMDRNEKELLNVLNEARERFYKVTKSIIQLQSDIRRRPHYKKFQLIQKNTQKIQHFFRLISLRVILSRRIRSKYVIKIQTVWRGKYLRYKYQKFQLMIKVVKARFRGGKVRRQLAMVKSLLIGCMVRIREKRKLSQHFQMYRKQILYLWSMEQTPLWYRSFFWVLIVKPTYLNGAICQDELNRLYKSLGFHENIPNQIGLPSLSSNAPPLAPMTFDQIFLKVQNSPFLQKLMNLGEVPVPNQPRGHNPIHDELERYNQFSRSFSSNRVSTIPSTYGNTLFLTRLSSITLSNERQFFYDQLKDVQKGQHHPTPMVTDQLFQRFGLLERKKRKLSLTQLLWTRYDHVHVTVSSEIVREILGCNANIDKMWIETVRQKRVASNYLEIAKSFIEYSLKISK